MPDTGVNVTSCDYQANIYTVSATVTPVNRLYLTGLFQYQDAVTHSLYNNDPSVLPYHGDSLTAMGSAGYALDEKTDVTAQYTFTAAHNFTPVAAATGYAFGEDNHRHQVQVGLSRRLSKNVIARIHCGYDEYVEASAGGFNNYRAQSIGANCTVKF